MSCPWQVASQMSPQLSSRDHWDWSWPLTAPAFHCAPVGLPIRLPAVKALRTLALQPRGWGQALPWSVLGQPVPGPQLPPKRGRERAEPQAGRESAWLAGPAPSHPLSLAPGPAGPLLPLITAAFQHFFALYGKALGTRPVPASSQGGENAGGRRSPPKTWGVARLPTSGCPPHPGLRNDSAWLDRGLGRGECSASAGIPM